MYSEGQGSLVLIVGLVNIIWLAGLTFIVLRNNSFIKQLFSSKGGNFKEKLEEVLKEFTSLEDYKDRNLDCIQKIVLKRYNPYKDTGGDQSFSVVLLDGRGDGVIISSLHSRSQTRVFAKPILNGKEEKFEFSEEEREIIKEALFKK